MVGQLIPIIDTAVMMFVNVTHKKLIDETIMTHRMIAEAIARHDPLGAKSAMVMHLNFNRTYIKKVYDGEDPDDGTVGMAAVCKMNGTPCTERSVQGVFRRAKSSD